MCRTRVYENSFGPKTSVGRGNLSFSTMNLVKIAIDTALEDGFIYQNPQSGEYRFDYTKNDQTIKAARIERFKEKLSLITSITAQQLNDRYEFQKTATKKQFPLLMSGMWNGSEELGNNDTIDSVINQGTLGIGFIGLAEALVALTGKHHGESDECQGYGLSFVEQIYEDCKKFTVEYGHNYGCLATPAEGLSGKFTKVDKKIFGEIPGVTDKDFYTNSNHVPVYYNCSMAHKFAIEGPYHKLTTAGHIAYCEIDGDATKNWECMMDIVDEGVKNDVGYMSINHFQRRCPNCNYEENEETTETTDNICPCCGTPMTILQRITGYLVGTTDRWNAGKLDELNHRVQHDLTINNN